VRTKTARNLVAFFIKKAWTLIIEPPSGSGATNPSTGTYELGSGVSVTVTAIPSTGFIFDHWLLDGEVKRENPLNVSE
jgi:hypothetical protein